MTIIETLDQWDQALFLMLNGWHTSWLDPVMWWSSQTFVWIPWYAILLFFLIRHRWNLALRKDYRIVVALIVGIAITIILADQLSSGLLKPAVGRLRPSHNESLQPWIHLLIGEDGQPYRGGKFGFVSSHAANSFALAGFLIPLLKNGRWTCILISWATLVSYSRIYLGVHYPGDVLFGALLGGSCGYLVAHLYLRSETYLK